jgi:hypothetical protein
MRIAYVDQQISALAAGALLFLSLSLGGSAIAGSSIDGRAGRLTGIRKAGYYLPVEDVPPGPKNLR